MRTRLLIGMGLAVSLLSLRAGASDSAAELAAGGITLLRSDGITMVSEDLTISINEIKVAYVFRNQTQAAITTMVAFPVPEFDQHPDVDENVDRVSKNPMGFSVKVDGKKVEFETEIKRKAGVVKVTHHWTQTFPPGRDLKVEHRYSPAWGSVFAGPDLGEQLTRTYCVGPTLLAALTKNSAYLQTVHYILKSGANWKGPIQKFKLTLVKRTPKDKISLCMPDTEKASPTTFVVERTDFTPTEDLQVLFVPANP
jgi:hypothetical protein